MPASSLVIQAVIADTLLKIVMAFPQEQTTSSTSDVTRHAVYDLQTEQFKLRKDSVFTHPLLADEIYRAPAKTRATLLDVRPLRMPDQPVGRQVTRNLTP